MMQIFLFRNVRFEQDKKKGGSGKKLDFFVIVVIQAFFVDENYVVYSSQFVNFLGLIDDA